MGGWDAARCIWKKEERETEQLVRGRLSEGGRANVSLMLVLIGLAYALCVCVYVCRCLFVC